MKFETKLNVNDYLAVVEEIANGFFNDNGEYTPHMGRIVSVAVFCDYCMKESVFQDVENPDMNVIMDNDEIIEAYHKALYCSDEMSFGAAYSDAMKLVDYRKGSLVQALGLMAGVINMIMSPDNLSKVYEASKRLKEIAESNKDNVVSLFGNKEA